MRNLLKKTLFNIILFVGAAFLFMGTASATTPVISSLTLNGGNNISLVPNGSTIVNVTGVISDSLGYSDITTITGKVFRTGVWNYATNDCTANINNCYTLSGCALSSCAGNSCNISCSTNIYSNADSTDHSNNYMYSHESWRAFLRVADLLVNVGYGFSPDNTTNVLETVALTTNTSSVGYGGLMAGANSGSTNQQVIVNNVGNRPFDLSINATDMCRDYPTCSGSYQKIPVANQRYSLTSFTYPGGKALSVSTDNVLLRDAKPTDYPSNSSKTIFFGMAVPSGLPTASYSGAINIAAVNAVACGYAECTTSADCGGAACNTFSEDKDGDGFGVNTCTVKACGTVPPTGYASTTSDSDDTVYCPNSSYNPPGTCMKCSGGVPVYQTSAENLYSECSTGAQGSATSCQANTCSGTSQACGYLTSASTCRSTSGSCDTAEMCTGSAYTCPTDGYASGGTLCSAWGTCTDNRVSPSYSCTGTQSASSCNSTNQCNQSSSQSCSLGTATTVYRDVDGDSYGAGTGVSGCTGKGYVTNALDCNDGDTSIRPGATEICGDGIDNNCNSSTDEGCGPVKTLNLTDSVEATLDMAKLPNGNPAILYAVDYPATAGTNLLHYMKCTDPRCDNAVVDNTLFAVDNYWGYFGGEIAIGTDGFPVISVIKAYTTFNLLVIKCNDIDCTPATNTVTSYPITASSQMQDMLIGGDGYPMVMYRDGCMVKMFHCSNDSCTTAVNNTALTLGSCPATNTLMNMDMDKDSTGVISYVYTYRNTSNNSLLYMRRCSNSDCTTTSFSSMVYSSSGSAPDASIFIPAADDIPVITYDMNVQRVIKCGNNACSSGNITTAYSYPDTMNFGYSGMLNNTDTLPLIFGSDGTNGIYVLKCTLGNCTTGTVTHIVADAGYTPIWRKLSPILNGNNLPVVAYIDGSKYLTVYRCANNTCN